MTTARFDLITAPWVPVIEGRRPTTVSLSEALTQAHRYGGWLPTRLATQQVALLRMLLAVLHRAVDGPRHSDELRALWQEPTLPAERITTYLHAHRDRFDLFHLQTPFMQVPELTSVAGTPASPTALVLDSDATNGLFEQARDWTLSAAEAAVELVAGQTYSLSGIRPGMAGDPRVRRGKSYPVGPSWGPRFTAVIPQGATLRETLLLNLGPLDDDTIESDFPCWEQDPDVAGAVDREPDGRLDLYTWQSRRIRLIPHAETGTVSEVFLGNGPRLSSDNRHRIEPHALWARSAWREKEQKTSPVYTPRKTAHPPWMWLSDLTTLASPEPGAEQIPAACIDWARCAPEGTHIQLTATTVTMDQHATSVREITGHTAALPLPVLTDPALASLVTTGTDRMRAAVGIVATAAAHLRTAVANADAGQLAQDQANAREAAIAAIDQQVTDWLATTTLPGDHPARLAELFTDAQTELTGVFTSLDRYTLHSSFRTTTNTTTAFAVRAQFRNRLRQNFSTST